MSRERESRVGFNQTVVQVGDVVRIRKGFGNHAKGRVESLGAAPFGFCVVELTKVSNSTGYHPGNRVEICNGWLEGSAKW